MQTPDIASFPTVRAYLEAIAMPWQLRDELSVAELRAHAGYTPIQVQVLANRGISSADEISRWMSADWRTPQVGLPGLQVALDRIRRAASAGERVVVYGDYDADGVTSCALMLLAVRAVGCLAEPVIPQREEEGRSLSLAAVDDFVARGVTLVITTDGGTTNAEAVDHAHDRGMDVIVTDHHAPHGSVARALAVVNPLLADEPKAEAALVGVGVALRVAEALLSESHPALLASLLDLVAIGTLADIATLTKENWALARAGLARMNEAPRPGIAALIRVSRALLGEVDEGDVNFRIAPRINAGGRMGEPDLPLRLLLAEDDAIATQLAARLDELNQARQRITEEIVRAANDQAELHLGTSAPGLIFTVGEGWPLGVLGLVAGRLVEEHHLPSVCASRDGEVARGSIRAPEGYDVIAALGQRPDLFRHFGGHPRAAGFSCALADLAAVRAHLSGSLVRVTGDTAAPQREPLAVDCRLPLSRASLETFARMNALAPFGPGFPPPLFVCRGARVVGCWASGAEQRSLRLLVHDGGGERSAIWHGKGTLASRMAQELASLPKLDIVYSLDAWRTDASREPRLVARVVTLSVSAQP